MNNPFDYTPNKDCEEAFRELIVRIEQLRGSCSQEDINFLRELNAGKMLGVLIATDGEGRHHTLYAFSGQLGEYGFNYQGFVEPVFDYLQPDGYFKTREGEISRLNFEINLFEEEVLSERKREYELAKDKCETEIAIFKETCLVSKKAREVRRLSGNISEEEVACMIRQSQFEKAELHRLKKRLSTSLEPIAEKLKNATIKLNAMKNKRRLDSEALQEWLFTNFRLLNVHGESKSLREIFATTSMKVPPSGAGECCAPKLLQAAYMRGWRPEAIAEYWYGKTKNGEIRIHGIHYPACRGKCLPILNWMLQGLSINPPLNCERGLTIVNEPEIIYENQWFCVVNKPSGMLSVPGKRADVSVQEWLEEKYGAERQVKMAHRLDQDTSGLMIATFGQQAYKVMQTLFATRQIMKIYIADLDGYYESHGIEKKGCIKLPISPDWLDRPRQRVDIEEGKEAVTYYEFMGASEGRSRIIFHPATGRTHQLRVHSASELGLGMPIIGDRIYGKNSLNHSERLHLHAHKLEFTFPIDHRRYSFESSLPF